MEFTKKRKTYLILPGTDEPTQKQYYRLRSQGNIQQGKDCERVMFEEVEFSLSTPPDMKHTISYLICIPL